MEHRRKLADPEDDAMTRRDADERRLGGSSYSSSDGGDGSSKGKRHSMEIKSMLLVHNPQEFYDITHPGGKSLCEKEVALKFKEEFSIALGHHHISISVAAWDIVTLLLPGKELDRLIKIARESSGSGGSGGSG